MSEQVTVKKVFRDQVNTKFGPGVKTSIFTAEYPDVRMSSFARGAESWKEGDVVSIEMTKNGEFTNFKPAGGSTRGGSAGDTSGLASRVTAIEQHLGLGEPKEEVINMDQQEDFNDFK